MILPNHSDGISITQVCKKISIQTHVEKPKTLNQAQLACHLPLIFLEYSDCSEMFQTVLSMTLSMTQTTFDSIQLAVYSITPPRSSSDGP